MHYEVDIGERTSVVEEGFRARLDKEADAFFVQLERELRAKLIANGTIRPALLPSIKPRYWKGQVVALLGTANLNGIKGTIQRKPAFSEGQWWYAVHFMALASTEMPFGQRVEVPDQFLEKVEVTWA